jgi:hypothetical protein
MAIPNTSYDGDLVLDVFGQRLVTIFTQISFCFPMGHATSSQQVILGTLTEGLQRLAKQFPWVAGQVVCEGTADGNTGSFKIRPLDTTPRISVKDLRNEPSMPSMNGLRQASFPMSSIDENLVAPRKSNSGRPGECTAEVFQLQVNFIKEGLILTFLGQHQAMDGIGQAQIIHLFSKACRNENFTEEELRIGNYVPENEISLYGNSWQPGPELSHNIVKPDLSLPGVGSHRSMIPAENGTWSHFNLSLPSIETLKSFATATMPSTTEYVSTDDAISAFVWQSIIRARLPRLDHATEALFARAVDLRRYLNIATTHPGFVQSMTYHKFTPHQLVSLPLGIIAADLRAAIDLETSTLAHDGRSFATLISRTPNKALTSYLAGFDMSRDVMLSSWANQNSYEHDFGLGLGKVEAVRRPRFDSFQGLVYLLPKTPAGEIGVVICLSNDDMDALKVDEKFTKYAKHVG